MVKVDIHVGLSLLAIKRLCESKTKCYDCPLARCCAHGMFDLTPRAWDTDLFPDANIRLTTQK